MEENTKSSNLYANIARRIIRNAQKSYGEVITTEDLVKFIVVRNDLIDYIAKNIKNEFPS